MLSKKQRKGLSLIEILIVIAIIAVIASVVFVALNPLKRFRDSRDSQRWTDVTTLASAVALYSVDNPTSTLTGLDGSLRMIGTASDGCSVVCRNQQLVYSGSLADFKIANAWEWFKPQIAHADSPTGWVSPTGFTDAGNQWINEANSYDGNVGSYATNQYGSAGYGQFIELTLDSPIISDKVRLIVDYLDIHIANVDIDVYIDGSWVDVFDGGDEATWNVQWVEVPFTKGLVDKARFRWNYGSGGYHYWLYEFQFYETTVDIEAPTCGLSQTTYVDESRAILQGTLENENGDSAEYRFQYGINSSYNNNTAWKGDYVSGDTFQELITGLNGFTDYDFRMQLRNSAGTTNCPSGSFTTQDAGARWLLPNSSSGDWENQGNAYDNNVNTYTRIYHNFNDPVWSDYLYFNHSPMSYDKIQFYALRNSEVNGVDVDIYVDGAWQDLYQGNFTDRSWVELSFPESTVTQSRIRFSTPYTNRGFFWQLYEYRIWRTGTSEVTFVTEEECLDIGDELGKYLAEMPVDPLVGSQERTYYAIKRENDFKTITIVSCGAEGDDMIMLTK